MDVRELHHALTDCLCLDTGPTESNAKSFVQDEQQNQQQSQQSTLPAPTFFHVDIAALFDRHFGSAETGTPEVTETSREPPLGIGFVTPTEVDDDDEEEKRERRRKRFGDSQ